LTALAAPAVLAAAAPATGASGILVPVVLLAAVLHATWNVVLKFVPDKLAGSLVLSSTTVVVGTVGIMLLPPPARASWFLLSVSAALHVAYFLLLVKSFEIGDFNQVYPLARGMSPVLVAIIASVLGDPLSGQQTFGIAVVCGGLAFLVFSAGRPKRTQSKALFFAVMTGVSISIYTLTDGFAVRRSGTAAGYTAWMMLTESLLMTALYVVLVARRAAKLERGDDELAQRGMGIRSAVVGLGGSGVFRGAVAGVLSPLAYGLVLWAQTRGALAAVSALRETSVVFGAALGAIFLREPFGRNRILAAVAIASGVLILESV
jgi:drug/metabolite transporter (DMT)-like permease